MPPCAKSATRTLGRTGSANVGVIGATLLAVVLLGARCGHRAVKAMARGVDEGIQQADTLPLTPTNCRASSNAPEGISNWTTCTALGQAGLRCTVNATWAIPDQEGVPLSDRAAFIRYDEPLFGTSLTAFDEAGSATLHPRNLGGTR